MGGMRAIRLLVFRQHWKDILGASCSKVLHHKYKYPGRELARRPGLKRPLLLGTLATGVLLGRALAVMPGFDRTALGAGSQSGVSSETVSSARALAEAKLRAAQSSYAESQAELLAAQRSLEQLNVTDADGDVPMQTYPADPTIETFTGASWNAQQELMKGHCDFCGEDFPHPSMVAYVFDEPPHFPFAKFKEPMVMKAVLKQVVNIYDGRKVLSGCIWCLQEKHAYIAEVERDGNKVPKLISHWGRCSKKSHGNHMNKHHTRLAARLHDEAESRRGHTLAEGAMSAQEIWEKHSDQRVRKANDWVTELGGGKKPFLWLFYGCPTCKMWTVGSNAWWRVQRRVKALTDDSTTDGADSGHWRCCGCFGRWTWAAGGQMRMLVLGFANEVSGFEPGYQFCLVGDISNDASFDSIDNKINFLKTATILKFLGGRPVSEDALLSVLEAMQDSVNNKFKKGMNEVTTMISQLVSNQVLDAANVDIICQDARLSMPGPGRRFLVITQAKIEEHGGNLERINKEEFHALLDIAASTYDIEGTQPSGKGPKRIKQAILDSPAFRMGRILIASRM